MRFEFKFALNPSQFTQMKSWLDYTATLDPYLNGHEDYPVLSQYLDTPSLDFFYLKIEGEFQHVKLRLRAYRDYFSDSETVFVEAKIKYEQSQKKIRIPILHGEFPQLLARSDLPTEFTPVMEAFFELDLRPIINIYYRRRPYVYFEDGVELRLNFDSTALYLYPFENRVMPNHSVQRLIFPADQPYLLEVKTPINYCPAELQNMLRSIDAKLVRYSKYALGVQAMDKINNYQEVNL